MHVLDPNNTTHTVYLYPRYYDTGTTLRVDMTQEDRDSTSTITPNSVTLSDQYMVIELDLTCVEGENYGVKVYDSTNDQIYYRGKVFVTEQTPQEFKLYG